MNSLLIFLLLILSGTGILPGFVLVIPILGIGLLAFKKKLIIPEGFLTYLLFIGTVVLSLLWTKYGMGSLYSILLLLSGGCVWIYARNYKINVKDLFVSSTLFLTLIYYVLLKWGDGTINYLSVIYPSAVDHSHIGELWALVLPIIIWDWFNKKGSWRNLLLIVVGFVVVSQSFSRTAILSLGVGIILLGEFLNNSSFKIITRISLILLGVVFIVISVTKDTLFSRPYILQSILGFIRYPFGVGLGNFSIVSQQFPVVWGSFSTLAHNLIAETITGLGFLSVLFFYWIIRLYEHVRHYPRVILTIIIAIFIQWMFDYTYAVPIFVWMLFILLGSAELKEDKKLTF